MTASAPGASTTAPSVAWHLDDAEKLAAFLATPTGARLIARIAAAKPDLSRYSKTQSAKFLLGREAQHDELLSVLVGSASPASAEDRTDASNTPAAVSAESPGAYPDLDDDTQWPDHLRIVQPT